MTTDKIVLNGRFLLQSVTGVQRVARELLMQFDGMVTRGEIPPIRLLLPTKGEIIGPLALQSIAIERVGHLSGHAWEQIDLPRHAGKGALLCLGNTAPVARLLQPGRRTVTMVHDLSYKYFPAAYSWKFRAAYSAIMPFVLRFSDKVVTVSDAERASIETHYPFLKDSGRLSYLQNGGIPDAARDIALDQPAAGAEARPYGLYVGSLTARKNAPGILRSAIAFLRRYPEMRFVVIGASGASFESVDLAVPPDLADRFEFWGQVNDAERIYDAYKSARFLLFPSFYEASPLPPIEAMTFGCPVVSSRIPSLTERCGDAAVYCDGEDVDSISAAISALMDDPALWAEKSAAARGRAADFSWGEQARDTLALCGADI
ncbi:glycosyltransferase family 1 protein [Pseudooceanicola sediminis]|uniref:Glycosyltransferase family 1 protein n=1 Tax=Pseudooceanicola sediminis TaxID=2211117 RepID=A0A399IVF7_9RHOB|nr:glycosyltransferase family 1 protein [Pseudooceanicola sediminis]KAA2311697.1 glycosyltransferase family 4 protein [Puniceibacterium sp. HSS470]RII37138.1 glycosyltransferase family 1 protein [Pseudooceanicola sediminis]